jgi:pantoate kinase
MISMRTYLAIPLGAMVVGMMMLGGCASKADLAKCAYDAEIAEQTGLGTVSVIYDGTGAGAIVRPGAPGIARFFNVKVPSSVAVVTACLAPHEKRGVFSSRQFARKIVALGDEALDRLLLSPTLDELAKTGEWFSRRLGLETGQVRALAKAARSAGASYVSQNMIGHAIHALVGEDEVGRVISSLKATGLKPRIDVFRVGDAKAEVLP